MTLMLAATCELECDETAPVVPARTYCAGNSRSCISLVCSETVYFAIDGLFSLNSRSDETRCIANRRFLHLEENAASAKAKRSMTA